VQSPINTAYVGDFLSWALNLPQARVLVISDGYLDRLAAHRRPAAAPGAGAGVVLRHPRRPEPAVAWEPVEALWEAGDGEPDVEVTWTGDARIMFTSGTTGRSKGVIKQHASDYFSARTYVEVCGVTAEDTLFLVPAALPLERPGAGRLPGDGRRARGSPTPSATRRPASGARCRRRRHGAEPPSAR